MHTTPSPPGQNSGLNYAWPVVVGIGCCLAMALTFPVLRELMQHRPQFAGAPLRSSRVELVQGSPHIVMRKVRDDVAGYHAIQAEQTDVLFTMRGRRDHRGLRTIMDMAGEVEVRHTLTNPYDEAAFVLFKCPHPHAGRNADGNLQASALKLDAGGAGVVENAHRAWLWTGEIEPHASQVITMTYRASLIRGVTYQVDETDGLPVRPHRVEMRMEDLPSMRFRSSDGRVDPENGTVVWERSDFLPPEHFSATIAETRSLYTAMNNLLVIGPFVCVLFMVAVMSVLFARGKLKALQVITIAAGYAFYFPLVLYLSAKFRFPLALLMAFAAPGILLLNYTRILLGPRLGLVGGILFLLLFQVFPTLGAFAGWNRGIVLLCLGMVTLFVVIDLQNRALKRGAVSALFFLTLLCGAARADDQAVQVMVAGRLVGEEAAAEQVPAVVSFGTVDYELTLQKNYVDVHASLRLEVLRVGQEGVPVFHGHVHLLEWKLPPNVRLVSGPAGVEVYAVETGEGAAQFSYRAPIRPAGNRFKADFPLLQAAAGQVAFDDERADLEFTGGFLWGKERVGDLYRYRVGVAGAESLGIEAAGSTGEGAGQDGPSLERLYGIRITESQHLTVIGSDGTCTHFAEYQLPPFHPGAIELQLPDDSRIISASVDAYEIEEPRVAAGRCTIPLDGKGSAGASRRLSLRLVLPPVRLGFFGVADLRLPDPGATIGALQWTIVLPSGFETRVQSSGLEELQPLPDLSGFGDYGRVLQSRNRISLGKTLVPPGTVNASVSYRQQIRGMTETLEESNREP